MLTHAFLAALALAPVGAASAALDRLTVEAIKVAGDPFGKRDARVEAIHRLGRLGTDMAYDFLADHLLLGFPSGGYRFGDAGDEWQEKPCRVALTHLNAETKRRDPRAAAALLRALDKPRSDHEMFFYARAYNSLMEGRAALAREMIEAAQADDPSDVLKANLATLVKKRRW